MEEAELDIRRSFVEAQIAEFGRMLHELVLLIAPHEIKNVEAMVESKLYETWDEAQRPLLEALLKQL